MVNLTPEERQLGKENYLDAVGFTRREFLVGSLTAGIGSAAAVGAMYFGYDPKLADPVRVGVIGTGDEGNILIGALNPAFVQVVAIADIRPSSVHRAFHGDWGGSVPAVTHSLRPGLMEVYGWKTHDEASSHVKVFEDYRDLLKEPDVEAVIIALPLHLHASAAIAAMQAGKHVLTEKLMGHNVAQCKLMGRVSHEKDVLLSTGHQRHYSILYDDAKTILRAGLIGQIHHIRAQWHRGNLPGKDSWKPPLPGGEVAPVDMPAAKVKKGQRLDPIADQLKRMQATVGKERDPAKRSLLEKQIAQWTAWNEDRHVAAEKFGYQPMTLSSRERSALEELVRWRLWQRTGGGLMAELGSHQLDAASIFVSALRQDGSKAHPLSIHAVGGRHIFPHDRDCEDHVYCTFEFPGPAYDPRFDVGYRDPLTGVPDPVTGIAGYDPESNPGQRVVVTYSSINGNGYGGYGEIVLGTKGTLVLEQEQDLYLYKDADTATRVGVKEDKGGAVLDTQASGSHAALAQVAKSGPVSRGYREEIEHFAWCVRNRSSENLPKCRPEVALGDAVIALTANVALKQSAAGKGGYLAFQESWFDLNQDDTPDGSVIADERARL